MGLSEFVTGFLRIFWNKIRDLFKVKLFIIRPETKKKEREREKKRKRERERESKTLNIY